MESTVRIQCVDIRSRFQENAEDILARTALESEGLQVPAQRRSPALQVKSSRHNVAES